MRMTFENIFALYNFVGNIFRANLDENDRAAQKVTNKYQGTGVITNEEEEWVLKKLTAETKKIIKPYTKILDEDEFRIYLLEDSKLKKDSIVHRYMKTIRIPFLFEEFGAKTILLAEKESFLLTDMHNNENDKKSALEFYTLLFERLLSQEQHSFYPYYPYRIIMSDFLGLLFYYQVTGFSLTEKEYERIKVRRFGDVKLSGLFELLENIIRIGEMENLGIPLIPENPVIQNNIAMEISDRLGWLRFNAFCPDYGKEEK